MFHSRASFVKRVIHSLIDPRYFTVFPIDSQRLRQRIVALTKFYPRLPEGSIRKSVYMCVYVCMCLIIIILIYIIIIVIIIIIIIIRRDCSIEGTPTFMS